MTFLRDTYTYIHICLYMFKKNLPLVLLCGCTVLRVNPGFIVYVILEILLRKKPFRASLWSSG